MESDRLDPGNSNALSGAVVEAGAGIVMRRQGNGASRSTKLTCIRCGSCDHLHEQCEAKANDVVWGIDWAKRRKHRIRRRRTGKKGRKEGGKTDSGALKEVEIRSKMKVKPNEAALCVSKRLHRMMQFKEVVRANSEELRVDEDALERQVESGSAGQTLRTDAVTVT